MLIGLYSSVTVSFNIAFINLWISILTLVKGLGSKNLPGDMPHWGFEVGIHTKHSTVVSNVKSCSVAPSLRLDAAIIYVRVGPCYATKGYVCGHILLKPLQSSSTMFIDIGFTVN